MSHASGVKSSQELLDTFASMREESSALRALKIIIAEELMVVDKQINKGGEDADFDSLATHVEDKQPCFFAFKQDSGAFVLIAYVPDNATIRHKMVAASTRSTLKRELGISAEYPATETSELSSAAYKDHLHRESSDVTETVLTEEERLKRLESRMQKDLSGSSNVHSVMFPISDAASDKLKAFASGSVNFLQLTLNVAGESIELGDAKTISADAISSAVTDNPAFYFFAFAHTHEGQSKTTNVFIFSCPEDAPIKSKMVHSTTKAAVIDVAEQFGVVCEKKLEIRGSAEISESILMDEIYPPKQASVAKFAKPSRPGGGGRRLHRKKE